MKQYSGFSFWYLAKIDGKWQLVDDEKFIDGPDLSFRPEQSAFDSESTGEEWKNSPHLLTRSVVWMSYRLGEKTGIADNDEWLEVDSSEWQDSVRFGRSDLPQSEVDRIVREIESRGGFVRCKKP